MVPVSRGTGVQNAQRFATIHHLGLLDQPPDPAFDRLTRLTARLLHVPVVLVSLVDAHRHFCMSSIGLPEPWASQREIPLSHSLCRCVVERGDMVIIEDALQHPLSCTTLAIPGLHVAAYLGLPLIISDGEVVGSLCAIDTCPRVWDAEDVSLLRNLASAVVSELELQHMRRAHHSIGASLYESVTRFSGAFQHASIGMALVALDGQWLQVNQALCDLLGYTYQELHTRTFQHVTHPDDLDVDLAYVQQMLRGEIATYQMEKRYFHKDGHLIWTVLNVSLVRDVQGAPQYFVSQIQDITQRRAYEQERQQFIAQLTTALEERDTLLQQSNLILERTDVLYTVAATLNRTQAMTDILKIVVESAAAVLPAHRTVLITVDLASQTVQQQIEGGRGALHVPMLSFAELWEGLSGVVFREGQPVRSVKAMIDVRESSRVRQRRLFDQAGSILVVPIQSQGTILGTLTAINTPEGIDFSASDMTLLITLAHHAAIAIERTTLIAELHHQASIDGLTQLFNRRAWFVHSQQLATLAAQTGRPLSVILLDVDHFKYINDTYGHAAGDQALAMISTVLHQTVRNSDVVGRYGGEEFAILLPDTNAPTALHIAERIRAVVADYTMQVEQTFIRITASLGVTTSQGRSVDLMHLLKEADQALYAAKHAGRNRVELCQL